MPRKILERILGFLTVNSNEGSPRSDQALQRQRDLSAFSLACNRFAEIARPELYKIVHIPTDARLELFFRTVALRMEVAQITQKLSLRIKLCGDRLSGEENVFLCFRLFWIFHLTERLEVLDLDLTECDCCFRNSNLQDAANGANSKPQPSNCISTVYFIPFPTSGITPRT